MTDSRKAGGFYEPYPVDFKILRLLPEVGTIGGVHWKGRRARDVVAELDMEGVNVQLVGDRLRSMGTGGYVKGFPSKGGKIWARTSKGVALMNKEEEYVPS